MINTTESDNEITIGELSKKYPSIPWVTLLNKVFNPSGVFLDVTEKVHVTDPKFISELEKLIESTPKRVLANFLAWHVASLTFMYMPEKLREISLTFASQMDGTKKTMNRVSWCLTEIMEGFPISLSATFVKKYFNKQMKENIFEILVNVKNQIKKNLEEVN